MTIRLGILWAVLLSIWACTSEGKVETTPPDAVPVRVAPVARKDVPVTIQVIGNVEARRTVEVRSLVAGAITQVKFREGQDVKKGDLLFVIDPRPYEAALRQAEANLAKDVAQAKNAEEEAKRYALLVQKEYVAREEYERYRTNAEALAATVEADRAAVQNARVQLTYCYIHAPISGRVGSILIQLGNVVKANDVPLVTINQIHPIYVSFSVPEKELTDIKKYMGQGKLKIKAVIAGQEGNAEEGVLTFVDNTMDVTTGTIRLKGTFENKTGRLWPGQFVNVALTLTTQPDALVVPARAVQTGQQGQFVFVVKPDQTVEVRPVEAGRSVNEETVIDRGLSAGEVVVTDGQLRLFPGAKVEVNPEPAGAKPS